MAASLLLLISPTVVSSPAGDAATTVLAPASVPNRPEQHAEQILIKGERHTGTNFLQATLLESFGKAHCPGGQGAQCAESCTARCAHCAKPSTACVAQAQCCWKHGFASAACETSACALVFLVRSPYSWALSMRENGYGMRFNGKSEGLGFHVDTFLKARVTDDDWHKKDDNTRKATAFKNGIPEAELASCPSDAHPNVLQLWNTKVASYLQIMQSGTTLAVNLTTDELYDLPSVQRTLGTLAASGRFRIQPDAQGSMHTLGVRYPPFSDRDFKTYGKFTKRGFEQAAKYERPRLRAPPFDTLHP